MKASPSGESEQLAALELRFFDDWMAAEPEEATTLGLSDPEGRLRDPSVAAAEDDGRRARAALEELDAIERDTVLDRDGRLRAWAIRAHATERALAAERGRAEESIEAVPYAIMMLAHAAARAGTEAERAVVSRRAHALPAYVASAREALEAGARRGRPFSTAVVATVAAQLDSAPSDLQEIVMTAFASAPGESAARAAALEAVEPAGKSVVAFGAFLRDVVTPSKGARDVVALGEAEYTRRLRGWWSLDSLDDLRGRAKEELLRARARMIEVAAEIASTLPGAPDSVRSFADAKRVLDAAMAPRPSSADDILPRYEREIARAVQFCRRNGTFSIPEVCHCEVRRSPELWRLVSPCTNWPAPLRGGDAPGACAVLADPALHPLANVSGLAVHEGVPGHFLQSRAWQLRFGKARSPVRFLSVPDECGILRGAWIPHFMIEGWAVFAEARMEESGFYDGIARLFHQYCRSIHAARALADIGLHTEGWSRERVAAFLSEATGMPSSSCASQAVRYARSGLQALTYLIGQLEIESVRARTRERRGAGYDELAFQAELLDAGPVPPALLEDATG
ncbi:MAG: DUF885 domain-containing protein [Byssovorax sp.]